MYESESFGRLYRVHENYYLQSCPQYLAGTGDFENKDYVT